MIRRSLELLRACPNATPGPSRLPLIPVPIPNQSSKSIRLHRQGRVFVEHRYSYSSAASPTSVSSKAAPCAHGHSHPAFSDLTTSLSAAQPCFGARGDEVSVIMSPGAFYKDLLEMLKRARRRITISSLYIGVEETELVDTIRQALRESPHLRTTFMLDYHRSTRLSKPKAKSSASQSNGESIEAKVPDANPRRAHSTAHLLLPLVEEFGDRVEVWMYRSPNLKGILEKIVPERYDEGWGTWHGKWYCVDDEVILSGANLAKSYFTNRQDRYIHFHTHPSLLSYLSSLTRLYSNYSYLLSPHPPASAPQHNIVPLRSPPDSAKGAALYWHHPSIHPRSFAPHALATLTAFQNSWRSSNASRLRRVDVDTWFWPVVQAGVLGLKEEENAMAKVWDAARASYDSPQAQIERDSAEAATAEKSDKSDEKDTMRGVQVDLTSGYFGLYDKYKQMIIDSPAPVKVIAASPKSNGFYGSKGLSRLIPEGYTYLESRFHRDAERAGRGWNEATASGVRLREWEREGWTYHAKGIWLSPPQPGSNPFLTFVGSSNLSNRSLKLDTELSLLLMTSSPVLRKALGNEIRALNINAKDVGEETWKEESRRVSWLAWGLVKAGVEDYL